MVYMKCFSRSDFFFFNSNPKLSVFKEYKGNEKSKMQATVSLDVSFINRLVLEHKSTIAKKLKSSPQQDYIKIKIIIFVF